MKRVLKSRGTYIFGIIVLLFLDYAALDDITTGNEPNITGEWLVLVLSIPIIIGLIFIARKQSIKK